MVKTIKEKFRILLLVLSAALCLSGCGTGRSGSAPTETAPTMTAPAETASGESIENTEKEPLPTLTEILSADERVWRYTDDPARIDGITDGSWTEADFDDSGWLAASGSFGANKGRLEKVGDERPDVYLRHYLPNGDALPVYFFRLSFTADAEDTGTSLYADITYDDAVIVYLNGQVIFEGNTPDDGYPSPVSYGCDEVRVDPDTETFTLDESLLREGENILAVELHQDNEDSSDIYFELGDLASGSAIASALRNDTLCLGAGSDESEMLVTWQGPAGRDAYVQVEAGNGTDFTDGAVRYPADEVYSDEDTGYCTYRAVIGGLEPGDYIYRAVDADPSDIHTFNVPERDENFFFLCHGDPQIRVGEGPDARETYQRLAESLSEKGTPRFVLSLGDQSDSDDDPEPFRYYMSMPLLKTVPLAAVVGNHEKKSELFSRYFFFPNVDDETEDTSGDMSGDYWFSRGNTLFVCLNTNNDHVSEHAEFIEKARKECAERYGEPVWTVAALHYSFFSAGRHSDEKSIRSARGEYADMFREAGVDAVFSGHDHIYTRSKVMDGDRPAEDGTAGTVYFTLGSSTGSKCYDILNADHDYVAFADEEHCAAMTLVEVSDTAMEVTTYQDRDGSVEELDSYTIRK